MTGSMKHDVPGKHRSPAKSFRIGILATLFFLSIGSAPAASIYDPAYTFTNFVGKPPNSGDVPGDTGTATGTDARFLNPLGVAVDQLGNCYVADTYNHRIRKVTPAGVVSTLAGAGPASPGYLNGIGAAAKFSYPAGVAVTGDGNTVYVSDTGNNAIRRIVTGTGEVTTYAGSTTFGIANGIGTHAQFHHPGGIAVNTNGELFVTDTFNNTVRKITLSSQKGASGEPLGDVTTFAGLAGSSGSEDGTGSAARFRFDDSAWALTPGGNTGRPTEHPSGIAVVGGGDIYVADTFNQTIRRITQQGTEGTVTTVCGKVGVTGSADGNAQDVRFNCPSGMGVSLSGNIFVADQNNDTIRQVTQIGYTTTLAGKVGVPDWTDGTGEGARFSDPTGIAVFNGNDLFVADRDYCRITHGTAGGAAVMTIKPEKDPLPIATLGSAYSANFTVSGGTAPYTWAATGLPPGLTGTAVGVGGNTWVLSGTPTVPGKFIFTVSVTDSNDSSVAGSFELTIHALKITGTIKSGNVYYFQTDGPPGVTGIAPYLPTPPYVFNISGGTPLPAGLNYTRDGVVSGTPYETGAFTISLSVVDAAGLTGAATITFAISSLDLTITTTTLSGGTTGTYYRDTIGCTGGYAPIQFTLSSGSLPPGLSLDPSTGMISGTPTTPTAGLYAFTVQATGNDGLSSTQPLSISINGGVIVVNALTIGGTITSGTAYVFQSDTLTVTGPPGTPPYVFNVSGDTPLPGGLSYTRDGVFSGTPYITGTYTVDVTVQDGTGLVGTKSFTFTIGPSVAPTITTGALSGGTVGVFYSQTVATASTGGYAPIYFTLSSGSLPLGLSLQSLDNRTGIISGTPSAAGIYSFTVKATGNDGLFSRKSLSIRILTAFATWKAGHFTVAELANSAISGDAADPDGDGLVNLAEYAFGGDPKAADSVTSSPTWILNSSNQLEITFSCNASLNEITYTVQTSTDLTTWTDIAQSIGGGLTLPVAALSTVADAGVGIRPVTVTDSIPVSGPRFIRVMISINP